MWMRLGQCWVQSWCLVKLYLFNISENECLRGREWPSSCAQKNDNVGILDHGPKRHARFSHNGDAVFYPIRVGVRIQGQCFLYLVCSVKYCFPLFVLCNVLIISLHKLAFPTNVITSVNRYTRLLLKKSNVSPHYVKWE